MLRDHTYISCSSASCLDPFVMTRHLLALGPGPSASGLDLVVFVGEVGFTAARTDDGG